jgi:V/A-type H+/Na+-transporting ATPase subunit I
MSLRPALARWFELLVVRQELSGVLRTLAATGQVELQGGISSFRDPLATAALLPALRAAVDEYRRLGEHYAPFWPAPVVPKQSARNLEDIPRSALDRVRAWASQADPLIARLQHLANECSELERLRGLLSAPSETLPNLALFGAAGPVLAGRAYLLAPESGALAIPPSTLVERVAAASGQYLLALGPPNDIHALDESLAASKARRLAVAAEWPADQDELDARLASLASESSGLGSKLAHLSEAHDMSAALADLRFIEWIASEVPELAVSQQFASITGWTTAEGAALDTALEKAGFEHLLRFPQPPPGITPPVVLHNPRWVQPFELFARLIGIPAASEADPSLILALLVPLMFGFMFGDVGQGALLVAVGLALRKRYPALALLVPGGAAAIVFGFLFGSVFALEGVVPALWLKPLAQPIRLLLVSLVFGSGIILLGFALDALQYSLAGEARTWWTTRAGIVLSYLGVVASFRDARALWALPLGLAWLAIGAATRASQAPLAAAGVRLATSLQDLLSILINNLSFVRVGAFALAHAGLASAITGLAAGQSRPVFWLIVALGNAFVLAVEGLIVAIQTTRLVLFEFFVRFLHGSGRPFHPLPLPEAPSSPSARSRFEP